MCIVQLIAKIHKTFADSILDGNLVKILLYIGIDRFSEIFGPDIFFDLAYPSFFHICSYHLTRHYRKPSAFQRSSRDKT